jgi:hypothetical protein
VKGILIGTDPVIGMDSSDNNLIGVSSRGGYSKKQGFNWDS